MNSTIILSQLGIMSALSWLLVLTVVTCFVFIVVDKNRFIGYWLSSWMLCFVSGIFLILTELGYNLLLCAIAYNLAFLFSALTLLYGTLLFAGKPLARYWLNLSLAVSCVVIGAVFFEFDFLIYASPVPVLICIMFIHNGITLLKLKQLTGRINYIIGTAFILWGIHIADRPFLLSVDWLIPWGYGVAFILGFTASFGVLYLYLEGRKRELEQSERRFRLLAENARDVIYRYRLLPVPGFEYVSPSFVRMFGYAPEDCYSDADFLLNKTHLEDRTVVSELLNGSRRADKPVICRFIHKDGRIVWTEQSFVPIYDNNKIAAIEGIIRDVTVRKEMEEKLEYISLHDGLTGLYNRAFFQKKMLSIEEKSIKPGIVICDLDGLKLINDFKGHNIGDKLLVNAARIISECAGRDNITARIGGDEFAILQAESSENMLMQICQKIRDAVEKYNHLNGDSLLSISVGYAVTNETLVTLTQVFNEADNNMYKEKSGRSQSLRSNIFELLVKNLEGKDIFDEGNSGRLQSLIFELANSMDIPEK